MMVSAFLFFQIFEDLIDGLTCVFSQQTGDVCYSRATRGYSKLMNYPITPNDVITLKFICSLQIMIVVVGAGLKNPMYEPQSFVVLCDPTSLDVELPLNYCISKKPIRLGYLPKLHDSYLVASCGRCDTLSMTILPKTPQDTIDHISKLNLTIN